MTSDVGDNVELHGKGMYVDVTATPPFDDLRLPPLACHGKKQDESPTERQEKSILEM